MPPDPASTARDARSDNAASKETRAHVILRHAFIPLDNSRLAHLCGSMDEHLRDIESALEVSITRRNESFRIEGAKAQAERAVGLLQTMYDRAKKPIPAETFQMALAEAAGPGAGASAAARGTRSPGAQEGENGELVLRTRRTDLAGRTPNQHLYLHNILEHDITFGIGPAGTGKTFLAVACAVDALERSMVQRIILTRPAVEAGERLGFLPGDLAQKVDPYLRPLYDALYDLMGLERVTKAFEKGTIEVAPLAFMRGRTLNDSFIILDEAQNTTSEQMKMFLTRLGYNSKAVITGDVTQIDLPVGRTSGLVEAMKVVSAIEGISFVYFDERDVVRHKLIQQIVRAYEAFSNSNGHHGS